ncbi:Csa1 family protein [Carnobacterium gallinarum]|uniref:Csa1 family protein n=1 Tax=Carnobacterium gallinarum TaxID=2749 RepID=UPI0005542EA6|nr:Csa1 family protein [Carnobacterium gallinarum]
MKKRRKVIIGLALLICISVVVSGCKSKKNIVKEMTPLMYEYQKRPLMEYFSSGESSILIQNSASNVLENGDSLTKGMVLKYYPTEKKAYGEYFEWLFPKEDGKEDEEKNFPVMYENGNYYMKEGIELTEEIKNFKFMVEEFDFTQEYTKNLKIEKSGYNFEVPDYSLLYELPKNDDMIKNYIKNKQLLKYDYATDIGFSRNGNGYSGGRIKLNIHRNPNIYISESISRDTSETSGNDYRALFLGEETENEQETSDLQ